MKQFYKPVEAICDLAMNKYEPSDDKYDALSELVKFI